MIWEYHHQLAFVTIVRHVIHNYLSFAENKQGVEFLAVWSCQRLSLKNSLSSISFSCTVCIMIIILSETSETGNICMLIASFVLMLWHSVTNSSVYHHLWHLLWVMIQIVNGSEMSLDKQYFDKWLVSIKQQHCSFSRTEKNSNHTKHMKGFSVTRGTNVFRIKSDS